MYWSRDFPGVSGECIDAGCPLELTEVHDGAEIHLQSVLDMPEEVAVPAGSCDFCV